VIAAIKKSCFELGQIGKMDKVPLTFNVPLNRTVDTEVVKSATIETSGHDKTHYTAISTCADGKNCLHC
jgi:hypothetical protein